jgi:hypothetical protein
MSWPNFDSLFIHPMISSSSNLSPMTTLPKFPPTNKLANIRLTVWTLPQKLRSIIRFIASFFNLIPRTSIHRHNKEAFVESFEMFSNWKIILLMCGIAVKWELNEPLHFNKVEIGLKLSSPFSLCVCLFLLRLVGSFDHNSPSTMYRMKVSFIFGMKRSQRRKQNDEWRLLN